jgi:hypothetical protein
MQPEQKQPEQGQSQGLREIRIKGSLHRDSFRDSGIFGYSRQALQRQPQGLREIRVEGNLVRDNIRVSGLG